ncbi:hypothetical protein RDT67_14515 [Serratia fonticola]|jgi:hypothetical protein|uniref:Uncharacterized protein n=1 Tax=Serratia fonticola TaxID=47917 RepID=A0AAJ2D9S3_SERFO|nr:hypothetical protein [Serratia fonticola]MDQ9127643.1 hypothetical protein [Serratia fonticola]
MPSIVDHVGANGSGLKINQQVAFILRDVACAVAVENVASHGKESLLIITPGGRHVETPLTPSDVAELIDAYLFPILKREHGDTWQLVAITLLERGITESGLLSEFGAAMWQTLIGYIAEWIDMVGYGDARH